MKTVNIKLLVAPVDFEDWLEARNEAFALQVSLANKFVDLFFFSLENFRVVNPGDRV